jgi:hypothetical protein
MFYKYILELDPNQFDNITGSIEFENIIGGRQGTNIADLSNGLVPLVRTTTLYIKPPQPFNLIHKELIDKIKNICQTDIPGIVFNNGMVEIYDNSYYKMRFHSDQSIDLALDSYICIGSFYSNPNPDPKSLRKLIVQNKITKETDSITLDPNSVVIFSTSTNKTHVHKIILSNPSESDPNVKWLGITLRQSKQFIQFVNKIPYFVSNGHELKLADGDERKLFCKYKGIENQLVEFEYPEISYTISPGDLIEIK